MHARKTVLSIKGLEWVKQFNSTGSFDVAMGAYDSTNVYNFIVLYILDTLMEKFLSIPFCLYRDDTQAISRGVKWAYTRQI